MRKLWIAALALALGAAPAWATPPVPAPVSVLYGQTGLAVTSTSARVALPSTSNAAYAITITNDGVKDAYFAHGSASVVATTSDPVLRAGSHITIYSTDPYIAAITAGSDTTSLTIYQSNGPVGLATGASGGGGGGAVYGPTANGAAAGNPPILLGGTADGSGSGTVRNVKVDSSGNAYTSTAVTSSALPTGAASAANQTAVQSAPGTPAASAVTIQGNASNIAVPVSVASLPLPSGGATSALQTTGNSSLTSIATNTSGAAKDSSLATINTTLGTPFQAGGSIGNSSFAATQATPANLKAQVSGAGTPGSQSGGVLTVQGDPSGTPIPISGSITATNASVGATGSAVPSSASYAGMNVSGNLTGLAGTASGLKVDGSAVTQPISAAALPLPSGAATSALQSTINTTLGSPFQAGGSIGNTSFAATQSGTWSTRTQDGSGTAITSTGNALDVNLKSGAGTGLATAANQTNVQGAAGTPTSTALTVQGNASGTALPVSAASLPLPTGAATAANQSTGNGSLATIATNTTNAGTPTLQSGSTTAVTQASAASLNATVVGTGTFSVQNTAATPAGSNIIGKVGIDQTTPGTTNGVQVNSSVLPTGASTAANQSTGNTSLATIATNTTNAGTPTLQSGSTTAVTQATAASLNATVVGTGTFATQATQAPSAASTAGVAPTSSSALAANLTAKGSAGNLYGFEVSADSTLSGAAWWIMIYNATSAPTDGSVTPAKCYAVPLGTTAISGSFPFPVYFSTGIVIGVSTTGCFTKTASTHAFISADAQ